MIADVTQSLASWWAPALAFVAGVVSFASPCVFPLVPGYLSFVTGESAVDVAQPGADTRTKTKLLPIGLFIGGFTLVFTMYGAFATTFVKIFKGTTGQIVAGAVVTALGLFMIAYAFQKGSVALYAERRPFMGKVKPGVAGAFPLGMAFAAGWTPCIGPVLGGILAIAASGGTARGVFLLVCYSLGLGVPFVLIGIGIQRLFGALSWVKRSYKAISIVSGSLLVAVGILLMTGLFTRYLVTPLQRFAPGL